MAIVTTKTFVRTHITETNDYVLYDAESIIKDIKIEVDKVGGDEYDMVSLKTGEVIQREDLATAIRVLQAFQYDDRGHTNNEWVLD